MMQKGDGKYILAFVLIAIAIPFLFIAGAFALTWVSEMMRLAHEAALQMFE